MEKVAMLSKTAANFATLKECWAINKPIKKVKIAEVDESSVIFAAIIHETTMFDRLKEVHTNKKLNNTITIPIFSHHSSNYGRRLVSLNLSEMILTSLP